jgi:hypothetical protein
LLPTLGSRQFVTLRGRSPDAGAFQDSKRFRNIGKTLDVSGFHSPRESRKNLLSDKNRPLSR